MLTNYHKAIFWILICAIAIYVLFYFKTNHDNILTFILQNRNISHLSSNGSIIFFLETSTRNALRGRAACAVESAARAHPNHTIFVFHLNSYWNESHPTTVALKNIYSVDFLPIHLDEIFHNTSIEKWAKDKPWEKSKYKVQFLSDIIRLILLLKYGGIYLDSDVIVKKSLANLRNTAGSERPDIFSNGIMMFDKGNAFLKVCAEKLKTVSNWDYWGITGPRLYTTVLYENCHIKHLDFLKNISQCDEFEVPTLLTKNAFYAIPYSNWKLLFNPVGANNTLSLTESSYAVHLWNFLSAEEPIKFGSGQPYELLARNFCPKIYNVMNIRKEM